MGKRKEDVQSKQPVSGKNKNVCGAVRFSRALEVKSQRLVIVLGMREPLRDFKREVCMAKVIPQEDQSGSSEENGPEGMELDTGRQVAGFAAIQLINDKG